MSLFGTKKQFLFQFYIYLPLVSYNNHKIFFNPKSRWTMYREIYCIQLIKASHSLKFQKNVIFKRYKLWKVLDQNSGADVKGCLEEREQCSCLSWVLSWVCHSHFTRLNLECCGWDNGVWSSMLRISQFGQDDRAQQ